MIDERLMKMAKVLIEYSLGVKPGDLVVIRSTDLGAPLVREAYRQALRHGAHPEIQLTVEGINETFYREAEEEQLQYISPIAQKQMEVCDALLSISAEHNVKELSGIDPEKIRLRQRATSELTNAFLARAARGEARWCATQYPTQAVAQEAGMSLAEYEDFVFQACRLDQDDPVAAWKEVHDLQQRAIDRLASASEIRVVAQDTDLRLGVRGRTWINCDGKENFPDGEIFTAPEETSVEGHIRFSFPGIYQGQEIREIRLVFEEGRVVEASAQQGERLLHSLLDTDEGARRVGEFAIGMNDGIQAFTKNMLFDEKIGGTVHLALGAAYPESGGQNTSGIHWDMLCDMRSGGRIYADAALVYRDGQFVLD